MSTMTNNTRKMAYIAILSAVSFLLMFLQFPMFTDFLQVDFSIIPILVGLLLFDMQSAFAILLLRSVLKILFKPELSTMIGMPMNIVALGIFIVAYALIWKKNQTTKNYVVASLVSTLSLTLAMLFLNYVYALPLYMKLFNMTAENFGGIGHYLLAMVVPFNLVEGLMFSIVFYLAYLAMKPILKKI